MPQATGNPRYRMDSLHARSLENNPIGSPVERRLHVYLPPDYYEKPQNRYPVVYFLHGYDGNYRKATVFTTTDDREKLSAVYTAKIVDALELERLPSYAKFDAYITSGRLKPFIFVQPDGSLHVPQINNLIDFSTGQPATKGSYYMNSPHTGNFEDYIIKDVISYVDASYRTVAERGHRALAGGSMGGYGTLRLSLAHPDMFTAAAALSPSNRSPQSAFYQMVIPLMETLLGRAAAEKSGALVSGDIVDTIDMIYSNDRRLLPTVKRVADGIITGCDPVALENWRRNDLNTLIEQAAKPYKDVSLLINCADNDDFGFLAEAERLHATLLRRGVKHEYTIYHDPMIAPSPHIFGIATSVVTAVEFCQRRLGPVQSRA